MGRNRTRLNRLEQTVKPRKGYVTYFYDYDREYLYDKPCDLPDARLVTPEELKQTAEKKVVILVEYVQAKVENGN
jgi:hypothetical protein